MSFTFLSDDQVGDPVLDLGSPSDAFFMDQMLLPSTPTTTSATTEPPHFTSSFETYDSANTSMGNGSSPTNGHDGHHHHHTAYATTVAPSPHHMSHATQANFHHATTTHVAPHDNSNNSNTAQQTMAINDPHIQLTQTSYYPSTTNHQLTSYQQQQLFQQQQQHMYDHWLAQHLYYQQQVNMLHAYQALQQQQSNQHYPQQPSNLQQAVVQPYSSPTHVPATSFSPPISYSPSNLSLLDNNFIYNGMSSMNTQSNTTNITYPFDLSQTGSCGVGSFMVPSSPEAHVAQSPSLSGDKDTLLLNHVIDVSYQEKEKPSSAHSISPHHYDMNHTLNNNCSQQQQMESHSPVHSNLSSTANTSGGKVRKTRSNKGENGPYRKPVTNSESKPRAKLPPKLVVFCLNDACKNYLMIASKCSKRRGDGTNSKKASTTCSECDKKLFFLCTAGCKNEGNHLGAYSYGSHDSQRNVQDKKGSNSDNHKLFNSDITMRCKMKEKVLDEYLDIVRKFNRENLQYDESYLKARDNIRLERNQITNVRQEERRSSGLDYTGFNQMTINDCNIILDSNEINTVSWSRLLKDIETLQLIIVVGCDTELLQSVVVNQVEKTHLSVNNSRRIPLFDISCPLLLKLFNNVILPATKVGSLKHVDIIIHSRNVRTSYDVNRVPLGGGTTIATTTLFKLSKLLAQHCHTSSVIIDEITSDLESKHLGTFVDVVDDLDKGLYLRCVMDQNDGLRRNGSSSLLELIYEMKSSGKLFNFQLVNTIQRVLEENEFDFCGQTAYDDEYDSIVACSGFSSRSTRARGLTIKCAQIGRHIIELHSAGLQIHPDIGMKIMVDREDIDVPSLPCLWHDSPSVAYVYEVTKISTDKVELTLCGGNYSDEEPSNIQWCLYGYILAQRVKITVKDEQMLELIQEMVFGSHNSLQSNYELVSPQDSARDDTTALLLVQRDARKVPYLQYHSLNCFLDANIEEFLQNVALEHSRNKLINTVSNVY